LGGGSLGRYFSCDWRGVPFWHLKAVLFLFSCCALSMRQPTNRNQFLRMEIIGAKAMRVLQGYRFLRTMCPVQMVRLKKAALSERLMLQDFSVPQARFSQRRFISRCDCAS
jgi:hypothetical protein